MPQNNRYDVIIVGGGLAGLTCALHLSARGKRILLIEKNSYPSHKVCGEYISNEVLPYLATLGIDPFQLGAKKIDRFQLSTKKGKSLTVSLPLGGFGISRYAFDNYLYQKIVETDRVIIDSVRDIQFINDQFKVRTQKGHWALAPYVVGAFGKRGNLDHFLDRPFIKRKTPWLAIKAHYKGNLPDNLVALHMFDGGYCGLSKVEMDSVNVCYMVQSEKFKKFRNIDSFQKEILYQNPNLDEFFSTASMIFQAPVAISQISFQQKSQVEKHVFMVGDSAGLIHPLCGNGMAMAIQAAKIFSDCYLTAEKEKWSRNQLEKTYTHRWNAAFSNRLRIGALVQRVFLNNTAMDVSTRILQTAPTLVPKIISRTHGKALA